MKTVRFILALIFLSFIVVQYNDPDPIKWTLIYGVPMFLFLNLYKNYSRFILYAIASLYLLGFFLTFNFNKDWFDSEVGREGMGMLVCSMAIVALASIKKLRDN